MPSSSRSNTHPVCKFLCELTINESIITEYNQSCVNAVAMNRNIHLAFTVTFLSESVEMLFMFIFAFKDQRNKAENILVFVRSYSELWKKSFQ